YGVNMANETRQLCSCVAEELIRDLSSYGRIIVSEDVNPKLANQIPCQYRVKLDVDQPINDLALERYRDMLQEYSSRAEKESTYFPRIRLLPQAKPGEKFNLLVYNQTDRAETLGKGREYLEYDTTGVQFILTQHKNVFVPELLNFYQAHGTIPANVPLLPELLKSLERGKVVSEIKKDQKFREMVEKGQVTVPYTF
ncbi:MAG: hypothetical protein V1870_00770, partial [Candidatus Aenigmatarchaeota archaeon]